MIRAKSLAALVTLALAAPAALAQDVQYETVNGIRYQVVTQTTQRPITETHWEPRQNTVQRPQYRVEMHDSVRTYQVPVTEQQWVLGYSRGWNIFAPPKPSYRLMPVTRWETRTETVKIPVTKVDYIPEQQTQHVPVTNTHIAEEKTVRRVAIGLEGAAGGQAASVARNNDGWGGTSLGDTPQADNTFDQPVDRRR